MEKRGDIVIVICRDSVYIWGYWHTFSDSLSLKIFIALHQAVQMTSEKYLFYDITLIILVVKERSAGGKLKPWLLSVHSKAGQSPREVDVNVGLLDTGGGGSLIYLTI